MVRLSFYWIRIGIYLLEIANLALLEGQGDSFIIISQKHPNYQKHLALFTACL